MTSPPATPQRPAPADATPAPGRFAALRRRRRWLFALVVALLAEMAAAMVTTSVAQTPTVDEPVYVGAAEVYLRKHDLGDNPEHPPLGKLIIGAGLAFTHVRFDPSFTGTEGAIGRHLLYESGNDPWRLMFWGRLPVIVATLLFGLVVFAFATDLAGPAGGLVALALYAFSPDLIANGSLATLDVLAAGFALTSAWLLWRARRRPLRYLPLGAVALGAALATKMNTLPAIPVLLALAVLSVWTASRAPRTAASAPAATGAGTAGAGAHGADVRGARAGSADHETTGTDTGTGARGLGTEAGPGTVRGAARPLALGVAAAAGVAVVAVGVVWAIYLAVDPRLRWAPANVPAVHGVRGLVTGLLPFPRPYLDGMRIQFHLENARWGGFLFGRHYVGALWYYLPAALLVKTPLGMLALWLAGAVAMAAVPRLRPAAPYVLVPAAVLLAAAMTGSRDLGVRYAIFVPMFLAVAAAGVVAFHRGWALAGALALMLFVAVSSLRTFPYYLPYSNEAFGGPAKTYLRLHDSNVDWGQDLGRLADRLRQRYPGERVWLVYQGSGVPSYYGIHAADPRTVPPDQVTGLLVVSDDWIDKADGRLKALIRTSRPIDQVGHSITIFRRPPGPAS